MRSDSRPPFSTVRLRQDALAAWTAGVEAVRPERCVRRALESRADLDLRSPDVLVLAVGKAAPSMIRGAFASVASAAGPRLSPAIALMPEGAAAGDLPAHVRVLRGGHPHPTAQGMEATRLILAEVAALGGGRRLLLLLSGGASALLEAPVEGLTQGDLIDVHRQLVTSGLPIASMNRVRGCLSSVKNGGLASCAYPASVTTLAISDVEGDDPAVIGSGPTVSSPLPLAEARRHAADLVRDAGLCLPEAARRVLDEGTPVSAKPEALEPEASVSGGEPDFQVIASVADAVHAACEELSDRGYHVARGEIDGRAYLRGATAAVAPRIAGLLGAATGGAARGLVFGGETTVALPSSLASASASGVLAAGHAGRGGRNLDLSARLALALAGRDDVAVLAAGTDGCDGSSRAAGAIVDGATAARAGGAAGLEAALAAFDTEPALEAAGDLVVTGPTGTNVGDLVVAAVAPAAAGR